MIDTAAPQRHVVFTIPKRLRAFFRYDRGLNTQLFRAGWGSLNEVLGTAAGVPAAVLTAQTAGDALNFHPHLHGCLADGVFSSSGEFKQFITINQERLTRRFAELLLSALRKVDLIDDEVVAQILSQQHSGFSVWLGEPFCDAESSRFVARYLERGPVALEKLSICENSLTYRTKAGNLNEFDPLEFLALLTSHIPDTYESMTRYYGWYSCRARGERKKKLAKQNAELVAPIPEPHTAPSSSWAACIKRVYEIDPLECPKCQAKMRIVAFMHDPVAIANITRSLGLPDFTAPPKMPRRSSLSKRAGEEPELCVDEIPSDDV